MPDTKVIFLTSGTIWTVPPDWSVSNNTVECIGGGGGGATATYGAGGGGGGYQGILCGTGGDGGFGDNYMCDVMLSTHPVFSLCQTLVYTLSPNLNRSIG